MTEPEQLNGPEWPTQMQLDHAEIARLRYALNSALDELHYHFGCDPECEKRHADKSSSLSNADALKLTRGLLHE